ncbi:uncharacterized protein SPAPADRAFT_58063 [Spathaspora passalidarum NRRL Y-27907]|uniref:Uncharacterized protein n=1 Tax=Spathaspora passalidarum (strain NRRL Y-27907 / 11-Y1) TaxID=619300 RepID=G3AFE5_SPAPN|nr:uncharacterized protein SPAPADRAFT_58063 [Spathaspora passalidarum NRRL Y-27907]EGW34934.1 hypothetical protein SPAPADRAFT_58063 [Spathaspora passalidarum NRRL Y-27907]
MDAFEIYQQKYKSNVERMKSRKSPTQLPSQQSKPPGVAKTRTASRNITNSDINKFRKLPIQPKPQRATTKEILSKFTKSLPTKEQPGTLSVKSIQAKFTVIEHRGFKDQFHEVDKEVAKASRVDSDDPIVRRCISNMKTIADWYKTHKVQNEVPKGLVKPGVGHATVIESGIVTNLKKSMYTPPQLRKCIVPTHRIIEISSDDKFMAVSKVADLQTQEEKVVLLMKVNTLFEVKQGDEISLNNIKFKQLFNGERLDVYIAWEVFR